MDIGIVAAELLGGILAAALAGRLARQCRLGLAGAVIVGVVGGALGGLVLMQYSAIAPATASGFTQDPGVLMTHAASGAAGGAALAIVTGLLRSLVRA